MQKIRVLLHACSRTCLGLPGLPQFAFSAELRTSFEARPLRTRLLIAPPSAAAPYFGLDGGVGTREGLIAAAGAYRSFHLS